MKKQNGDAIRRAIWAGVFGFAGVMHFAQPKPFDTLVPPELPGGRRVWTYGSGAVELALGAAIAGSLTGRTSRSYEAAVSTTATAFLAGVWPGNIKMAVDWRDKPWPAQAVAIGRVPLQIPLIRSAVAIARG